MTAKRGGLGRGLGALIPNPPQDPLGQAEPAESAAATGTSASTSTGTATGTVTEAVPEGAGATDAQQPDPGASAVTSDGPDQPGAVPGARFAEVAVDQIHANAHQPRQVFDEESLAELTHSIREFGVLQPVVVRPDGDGYELVMGERRLRAATAAGLSVIPAIVRETADDAMLRDALLENVHRVQLNPLEEAAAYQQLLEEFGSTHEELARRLGRSRPQITNTVRLLSLPVPVQRRVAAGVLSAGHARALLGLDDRDAQDELAGRIVAEGLSVRATEELVALAGSGHAERKAGRRAAANRISAPGVTELADRLSDVFETRVRVDLGRRKGKITVEFASVDDLERIVAVMAPSVAATRRVQPGEAAPSGDDDAGSANVP